MAPLIALDTNVILRYLVQDDEIQSPTADAFFDELSTERPGFISLVVVAELAWVLRRSYGLSRDRMLDLIDQLLASAGLEFEEGETVWRAVLQARGGADLADALIADTAEVFGCEEVVTFDRQAAERLGMRLLG